MARRAYTLVEVLLALAVLAAIAAMAWPAMTRVYARQQLKEGAERTRVLAASARIRAIEAGLIFQFRYEPGGRRYLVAPYERPLTDANAAGTAATAQAADPAFAAEAGRLPERLQFAASGLQSYQGEKLAPDLLAGLPDGSQLAQASWSPPLLFFPDGTAEDATFEITDDRRQSIELSIRGLTGTVSVGKIRQEASR